MEESIAMRRSCRSFSEKELSYSHLSQLFWAAVGITDKKRGFKAYPSAGALYPLEVFVLLPEGFFHYTADSHSLKKLSSNDIRSNLMKACHNQSFVGNSPAVFVITAIFSRTMSRYGSRAERYVLIEVGHTAQNLLLEATALGLKAVPVGAFEDEAVKEVLPISAEYKTLYIIPVGFGK